MKRSLVLSLVFATALLSRDLQAQRGQTEAATAARSDQSGSILQRAAEKDSGSVALKETYGSAGFQAASLSSGDARRKSRVGSSQNLTFQRLLTAGVGVSEVFLQGNFIEVGIHASGSFGTEGIAPEGFHPLLDFGDGTGQLGFVVDPGQDGWDVGTPPQSGDFFVPGSPEEGWGVEWTVDGTERFFGNFGLEGDFDVPLTSLVDNSSGDSRSAVWEGTATNGDERLRITQTVRFSVNDLFFVMNVVMTNIGTVPLESLEYMRNVDPDQEEPLTGDFTTSNFVAFQPQRVGHPFRPDLAGVPEGNREKALVVANGLDYGITLGLGTIDSRATVSTEGFSNRDPDNILDTPIEGSEASPIVDDRAIALAYDLGTLAPGQSISIDYAYILNQADLEVALGQLAAVTILQPTGTVSGSNVLFQATTNDVPNTTQIEFFVNSESIGVDTTPDAGGVFERTFDSVALPNGPASLKAVASFVEAPTAEKTTSVTVDNSGPPIAFVTPKPGQSFSTDNIPVEISVLDAEQPPVRVSFFRETASSGSVSLGEDSEAPFTSSFGVLDLEDGETVIIKAVATDDLDRVTTIQVSGTVSFNDPPDAKNDTTATAEETPVTINVLQNDSDPNEDPLAVSTSTNGAHGTVVIDPGFMTVTYTPELDFNGDDEFEYVVTDGELDDTAKVVITVRPVNDPPVAVNDTVETVEGTPVIVSVLGNDSDVDGGPLTIVDVTDGSNGVATVNEDLKTVTYTPNPGFTGKDTVTYTISDGNEGGDASAKIFIQVIPSNSPPVAVNDTVTTDEDTPLNILVLTNDTDPDGDDLTVSRATQGANGTVVINPGSKTLTYTPKKDFNGVDEFEYSITDGELADTAKVLVRVDPVNDAPVAVNDTVRTNEDEPVTIDVLGNDSDVDLDPLTITQVVQPANGKATITVVKDQAGSGTLAIPPGNTKIDYEPNSDFNGIDTFAYMIGDGHGGADTASVRVTVDPVNDAPVATNDTTGTDEDVPVIIPVLGNDSDVDGDALTVSEVTQPSNGEVAISEANGQGGFGTSIAGRTGNAVVYSPNKDFNGADSFTYIIGDGNGGADTAKVSVTVNPINDDPVAQRDSAATDQGEAVSIPVLRNDTDVEGDALKVSAVVQAAHGAVTVDPGDTTVTYEPKPEFSGTDSLRYTADDGNGGTSTATVVVFVHDRLAPGKPVNLTAVPSGWTNADTIWVTWENPEDSTGIVGFRFTVDIPPAADDDGLFVPGINIQRVPIPTTPDLRGEHTAYVWLVDGDGNTDFNNHDTVTVRFDDVPPTTTDDVVDNGWYNGDAKIQLTAEDGLSGVSKTFYRVDGANAKEGTAPTVSGEGRNHTLEYWSVDGAGNVEPTKASRPIHIDLTPPTARATSAGVTQDQRIAVSFESSDNLSGVEHLELWFRKDFSFWVKSTTTYSASPILFGPTFGEGTYSFIVAAVDTAGNSEARGDSAETTILFATSAVEAGEEAPTQFTLAQNYPNPFNPSTTLRYSLPEQATVRLEIYDLLGRKVRTLVHGEQSPGNYTIIWDGRGDHGALLPSGVYLYRIQAGSFVAVRKMVLVE